MDHRKEVLGSGSANEGDAEKKSDGHKENARTSYLLSFVVGGKKTKHV